MSDKSRYRVGRVLLAGLVAPAIGILACTVVVILWGVALGEVAGELVPTFGHVSFLVLLFGLPAAWVVEAAVGLPAYVWLVRRDLFGMWTVTIVAALSGGVLLWAAVMISFPSALLETWPIFVLGMLGGCVAGAVLWYGALRGGVF